MYGASKYAIIGLIKSIAKEYSKKGQLPFWSPAAVQSWAQSVILVNGRSLLDTYRAKLQPLFADPPALNNMTPSQFASAIVGDMSNRDWVPAAAAIKSIQVRAITVVPNDELNSPSRAHLLPSKPTWLHPD